ncbi:SprT family protein [Lysinibacillus piscis]|uniref:Protein SprT-like n=1 Tax=Lysinibacillus piscis TaxID=2518931 RepID=A0ABQ5NMR1_9BACI|nr:SprT family protein [Lysinibacillus sp. KH24]GLC89391.1 protein SprT [Lysinibacillus sp. KH24]
MNNEELQQLVCQISLESFQKPFVHQATFNMRLRSTGGRYLLQSHNIEINPKALELHGLGEIEGIVRHELCHYHLHLEGKGYQHRDQDFRALLKKVNAPRFCSNLKAIHTKKRTMYTYKCAKCQQMYIRKIRMNIEKYCCSRCLGRLKLME